MLWKTVRTLFHLALSAADRLVDGYLLHPRRRFFVLSAMSLALVCLVIAAVDPATGPCRLARSTQVEAVPCLQAPGTADREAYLLDRIWFSNFPGNPHDPFTAYYFSGSGIGLFFHVESRFRIVQEVFLYSVRGDGIEFRFPHTRSKAGTKFAIVDHRGPEKTRLRLTLANDPRGEGKPKAYFGHLQHAAGLDTWLEKVALATIEEYGK